MSQREFEAYLSLLSKLLPLTSSQREDVADELRDHLEERTARLVAEGLPAEDAARQAIEELGDAAVLARDLARPGASRRMRVARWALGSAVAMGLAALFFWPIRNPAPDLIPIVVAQEIPKSTIPPGTQPAKPAQSHKSQAESRRASVERKLEEENVALTLEETPLRDAIEFLSQKLGIAILLDRKRMAESGVNDDTPITLKIEDGTISNRTALELVLDEAGLIYTIREGLIVVTTRDQEQQQYEVRVYPCNDLLNVGANQKSEGAAAGAAGPGGPSTPGMGLGGFGGFGSMIGGGMGGGAGAPAPKPRATHPAGEALLDVIMSMTGSEWQDTDGTGGNLREYDGMVIVRHNQAVHRRIDELLAKMRETRQK